MYVFLMKIHIFMCLRVKKGVNYDILVNSSNSSNSSSFNDYLKVSLNFITETIKCTEFTEILVTLVTTLN